MPVAIDTSIMASIRTSIDALIGPLFLNEIPDTSLYNFLEETPPLNLCD